MTTVIDVCNTGRREAPKLLACSIFEAEEYGLGTLGLMIMPGKCHHHGTGGSIQLAVCNYLFS